MTDWQPIETAPRDGTKVLVCYSPDSTYGYRPMVAWYEESPRLPWNTAGMASYLKEPKMWPAWFSGEYTSGDKKVGIDKDGGPEYWAPIPAAPVECRVSEAFDFHLKLRGEK